MNSVATDENRATTPVSLATRKRRYVTGSIQSSVLWIVLVIALLAGAGYSWRYFEARPANGQAGITLSGVQLTYDERQAHLQAAARIRLPATVQAGLDSGVPLTFVLRLKLLRLGHWWQGRTLLDIERHYTLTYYELTRHYRVSALDTDINRNYRSLTSALEGLGKLQQINIELDQQQMQQLTHLSDDNALMGSLEMRLLTSALPLPLQPIIRSSWTLASEEYRWPVT